MDRPVNPQRHWLDETLTTIRRQLLDECGPAGHWIGELSGSALSTATACFALARLDRQAGAANRTATRSVGPNEERIERGLRWLIDHQNADGG